jgi:hypothetical protein
MVMPSTLRVECGAGGPVNEYRVQDGCVELRILSPCRHDARQKCPWRPLSADEILLHLSLDTALAQWLFQRFRFSR